jgi:hypothetical protein
VVVLVVDVMVLVGVVVVVVAAVTVKDTDGLVIEFQVAVILAVPVETPIANPIDEIVATEGVSLAQVT